jgi:hypothetical protein
MQSVNDKPEQFSANVGSLESAGSQAAERNDGRKSCKIRIAAAAAAAVAAAVSAVFGRMALPNMCWSTPAVRECFSATIRGRAECPPSPVVFFPSSLFSHPIEFIQKENIHLPVVVLPQLALFLLIHIEFIPKKKIIQSPPSCLLPRFTLSHPIEFIQKKAFISLIVFFPSSLFSLHPIEFIQKKNIHLPNCFLPQLALFSASNRIHPEKKHSCPSYLLS